jgi:hypothetical protein
MKNNIEGQFLNRIICLQLSSFEGLSINYRRLWREVSLLLEVTWVLLNDQL